MKAITLRQPWAWAILEGGCDVLTVTDAGHQTLAAMLDEGRTRQLVLHAADTLATAEDTRRIDWLTEDARPVTGAPRRTAADAGGLVGTVTLTGERHHSDLCLRACTRWGFQPGWHYELAPKRVVLDRLIPATGSGVRDLAPDQDLAVLKGSLG